MDLNQVNAFLAAARALHFTRAADELGIAQPTLSLRIAELEREFGTPLFDRVGRGVRLTAAGEVFLAQASAGVTQLARAREAVEDLKGLRGGTLRVGVTHLLATRMMPTVLAEFHRRHPQVRLVVEELQSGDVEAGLLAGELDLGVTFTPVRAEELLAERLFDEPIVLAVGRGHRLARHKSLRLRELDGVPLALTGAGFAARQVMEELAERAGIRLNVVMEFNDIDLLIAVVQRSGSRVATIVARRAAGERTGLVLVPLVDPVVTRTASLLWHRDRYRTAAARVMAEMIAKAAGTAGQ